MREVVWTRAAEADLQAAFDECEERVDGSGGDLLNLVDSAIELLRQFPEMAPFFHAPMRRLLIRTGRHGLFYTVEDRGIIIHAFSDLRRDANDLRRRFRKLFGK